MGPRAAESVRTELRHCPRAAEELYAAHLIQGGCEEQEQVPPGRRRVLREKHALGFKQGGLQV